MVVLTGAGMSAESGVPTFRDALSGLWARFDPQRLATPEAFLADPALVFGWYLRRTRMVLDVAPHAGYHALVRLARLRALQVITQNVDGLHARAGSKDVVSLHGSLLHYRCTAGGHPVPLSDILALTGGPRVLPPCCGTCGSPVRPGVVWFGEPLSEAALARAHAITAEADVVLVVGTSALVYPAAGLPHHAARHGARLVEINPEPTPLSASVDIRWPEPAGTALPALAAAVLARDS